MRRGSRKFSQGYYTLINPEKYVGKGKIIYRSSWEHMLCRFCDTNENILEWASEPLRIPYTNPLTGKKTTYVPDFLIRYRDKNNKIHTELVEVKPHDQSTLREGMNPKQRAIVALNEAKWEMARKWCKKQNIKFRILTEKNMYYQTGRKK